MSRIVRFDRRYRRAAERLGIVHGSERGRAVGRAIAALVDADELPGPADARVVIPPVGGEAFVRRVPGRNLWLWFRVEGNVVLLRHVSSDPPVPVAE